MLMWEESKVLWLQSERRNEEHRRRGLWLFGGLKVRDRLSDRY